MNALRRAWDHFEEGFIAFLLAAMTLVVAADRKLTQ